METERYKEICNKYGFEEISEYEDNIYIKVDEEKYPEKNDQKKIIRDFLNEDLLSYHSKYVKEIKIDRNKDEESREIINIDKKYKVRYVLTDHNMYRLYLTTTPYSIIFTYMDHVLVSI